MRSKISVFALCLLLIPCLAWAQDAKATALSAEQKAKRQADFKRLKERNAAINKLHKANTAFLKNKLSKNKILTPEQKDELIAMFDKLFSDNAPFDSKRHSAKVSLFEQIAADSKLTQKQRKAELKDLYKSEKERNRRGFSDFMKKLERESKAHPQTRAHPVAPATARNSQ